MRDESLLSNLEFEKKYTEKKDIPFDRTKTKENALRDKMTQEAFGISPPQASKPLH